MTMPQKQATRPSLSGASAEDDHTLSSEEIQQALARILASELFLRSERLTQFLTYVVQKTLQGESEGLKEYHIGVEVCGRKSSYDPRTDPVVRVEARRLRSALDLYYAQAGRDDGVQIALPKGGYVPRFLRRTAAEREAGHIEAPPPEPTPSVRPSILALAERWRGRKGWALLVALLLPVLIAGLLGWRSLHGRSADVSTLVLADFSNTTGDAIFDRTLREGLAAQLEQSPYLSLLSDAQIAQTLALMGRAKDARLTTDLAREVCIRNGKAAVIDGSISSLGSRYVVGLRAIDCQSGGILALEQEEASNREAVLGALAKGAAALRRKLGESLASIAKYDAPPESVTTPSLDALQAYSLGFQVHVVKLDEAAAADLFRRAIALDPNFAMAYAREAVCEINLGDMDQAAENLRKAYDLHARVSEREGLFILSLYHEFVTGDLEQARKTYELRAQIYPHDDIPIGNVGNLYFQLGQYDKALSATQEAIRRNPGSRIWNGNLVSSYVALGRFAEARSAAEAARLHQLDSPWLHLNLYLMAYLDKDESRKAVEAAQLKGAAGFEDVLLDYQAQAAARAGRLVEARSLARSAVEMALEDEQADRAALYQAQAALNDAWVGNRNPARQQAQLALQLSTDRQSVAVAAVALALAGDSAAALRLADDLLRRFPENTVIREQYVPTIRAAAALHGNPRALDPLAVVRDLEVTTAGEFGSSAIERVAFLTCYPIYLRGEAYLASHQGAQAAAEFQKILDRPQLVLTDPVGAMAQLRLAQAYEQAGDSVRSAAAYKALQEEWKHADPSVLASLQAKGAKRAADLAVPLG